MQIGKVKVPYPTKLHQLVLNMTVVVYAESPSLMIGVINCITPNSSHCTKAEYHSIRLAMSSVSFCILLHTMYHIFLRNYNGFC